MSTVTVYPEADTTVCQGSPTTNFDSWNSLYIGSFGVGAAYRAWVRFDISSIPSSATINSATFNLGNYFEQHNSIYPADYTIEVARSTDITWVKTTITWNNAPNGTVGSVLDSYVSTATNLYGYVASFDVASAVSSALASGKISFRAKYNDETVTDNVDSFEDRDYTGPPPYPSLVVDYTASDTGQFFLVM